MRETQEGVSCAIEIKHFQNFIKVLKMPPAAHVSGGGFYHIQWAYRSKKPMMAMPMTTRQIMA